MLYRNRRVGRGRGRLRIISRTKVTGFVDGKLPSKVVIPEGIVTNSNPTRYGYVFDGWYTDAAYTEKVTSINKNAKKALTLYAKWRLE